MKKICRIHMLSTEKATRLFLNKNSNNLHYYFKEQQGDGDYYSIVNKHLYVVSDDVVKVGDWCLWKSEIIKAGKSLVHGAQKVIATTNTDLKIYKGIEDISYLPMFENLPLIPDSFIESFVKQYNNKNLIKDIYVEYTAVPTEYDNPLTNPMGLHIVDSIYEVKIDADNQIEINLLKDSWNIEEVKQLCHDVVDFYCDYKHVPWKQWFEDKLYKIKEDK